MTLTDLERREHMVRISHLPKRSYDWASVETAYVEGVDDEDEGRRYPSLAELSGRFSINERLVQEHCRRHQWVARRAAFQERVAENVREARLRALGTQRVEIDTLAADTAQHGIRLVEDRLAEVDVDKEAQRVARAAYGELKARGATAEELDETGYSPWQTSAVDARELQALAAALAGFHQVAARATGGEATQRVELSGGVDLRGSVVSELGQDDVDRLAALVDALEQVRFGEIVDADVVEPLEIAP